MKKLYMKIYNYEEFSGSLIVGFASDETASQNPDDYGSYAYQPASMFPGVTDPNDIKKRIAINGKYMVEQQKIKEDLKNNTQLVSAYTAMVDSLTEYDIENDPDFYPPTPE